MGTERQTDRGRGETGDRQTDRVGGGRDNRTREKGKGKGKGGRGKC